MRMFILWVVLVILGNLNAQTLVVAGYESESQRKIAERLIEQSREKSWNRREWEAHCRENGYVVVGSGDVIYLIPVYYTPEFIEYSLVPFVEHLAQLHLKVTTQEMLSPPLKQVIFALAARAPDWGVSWGLSSPEIPETKLRSGAIAVGLKAGWLFESASDSTKPLHVLVDLQSLEYSPTKVLETFRLERVPTISSVPKNTGLSDWSFLFSHPLGIERRIEHMKAYLEWVLAFQKQLQSLWQQTKSRIQSILCAQEIPLQMGATYSISEIEDMFRGIGSVIPLEGKVSESLIYREWQIWLTVLYQNEMGTGTTEVCVPLETLMGMKRRN